MAYEIVYSWLNNSDACRELCTSIPQASITVILNGEDSTETLGYFSKCSLKKIGYSPIQDPVAS